MSSCDEGGMSVISEGGKEQIMMNLSEIKVKAGIMPALKKLLVEMTDRVEKEIKRRDNLIEFNRMKAGRESVRGISKVVTNIAGDETGGENSSKGYAQSIGEDCPVNYKCIGLTADNLTEDELNAGRALVKGIWEMHKVARRGVKGTSQMLTINAGDETGSGGEDCTLNMEETCLESAQGTGEDCPVNYKCIGLTADNLTEDELNAGRALVKGIWEMHKVARRGIKRTSQMLTITAGDETDSGGEDCTLNMEETCLESAQGETSNEVAKAEEVGNLAIKSVLVRLMRDMPEEERLLLFFEENGFESAQRVNALDAKLVAMHDQECAKSAVEWCINRMCGVGATVMDADELISLASKLVVSSSKEYCELLIDECAKSAAELCIKKIRVRALVDKLDKRTILESEITENRRTIQELLQRLTAFKYNMRFNKVGRALSDEEAQNINEPEASSSASAFLKQSVRVLMEMTTTGSVKFGEKNDLDSVADKAIALADEWAAVTFGKCVLKVCVGVLVDKRSVFEVLKSEIAEAWKTEKEVKDSFVIYQRKQTAAHHSQGSTSTVVRGGGDDERRRYLNLIDRFGLVWKKVSLFVVGTVAVGIAAVVLGRKIRVWSVERVGLFAVGVIAVVGLAKGQCERQDLTCSTLVNNRMF